MTLPRDLSVEAGESEMSWGPGMFPHPDSNFQAGRLPFPEDEPIDQGYRDAVAARRTDSTVGDETDRDMLFAKGNPDRFGAQPALVRAPVNNPPKTFPVPDLITRVTRDE